jgi:MFS family permease
LGPLLGGVFTTRLSWRYCFYINLPIGGVSAVLIFFMFQNRRRGQQQEQQEEVVPLKEKILQMDPLGTMLVLASLVCLLLVLQLGGTTKPWNSSEVIGTLVGFVVLLILFGIVQWWFDERSLVVPRLLKQKTLSFMMLYQFFNGAVFAMPLYYLPIYFQVIDGVSASQSGIWNVPMVLGAGEFLPSSSLHSKQFY